MLVPPSAAELKTRFPRFAAVADGDCDNALDRAATQVDETWAEGDRDEGMFLFAAHQLTLDGQGTGSESELNAQGLGGIKVLKSGSLNIERFDRGSAEAGSSDTTSYGTRFQALRRANKGGARVTGLY